MVIVAINALISIIQEKKAANALEQICGSEVVVEYDKLIDRQLERAAITSISGFSKLFTDASKVLKV